MQALVEPSVLASLRRSTADQHRAIEAMLRLDTVHLSLPRYVAVLQGFAHFWRCWEPLVEAALPDDLKPWLRKRSRRAFLDEDLRILSAHVPPNVLATEMPPWRLTLSCEAQALGSLYVLEGSALGGQVIARHVQDTLGLSPDRGAAYFHGWGKETGPMWRDFRQVLAQRVGDDAAVQDQACQGAMSTFEALMRVFEKVGHA